MFLNFSQNSEENTCAEVFLIMLERPATLLEKSLAQVFFCELYEIFKKNLFREHLQAIAFGKNAKNN